MWKWMLRQADCGVCCFRVSSLSKVMPRVLVASGLPAMLGLLTVTVVKLLNYAVFGDSKQSS